MLAYLIVAVIPLLTEFIYNKGKVLDERVNEKRRKRFVYLAAFPMFFLIAFRNQSIGADTGGYIDHFIEMTATPWANIFDNTRMEHGYVIFVKLLTLFTNSSLAYQVICALIYYLMITSFINQLDKEHFFVLFLYATLGMYTFMFTGTRQCLAVSICLFSYRYIKNRKIIPFALWMVVAFFFHKSAVLFVAAYFIYGNKINARNIVLYLIVLAIIIANLNRIQNWFNDQLDYDYGIEGNAGGIIFAVFMVIITGLSLILSKNHTKTDRNLRGVINVGLIATVFWTLRIITRVAERPSYYFLLFAFVGLAYSISLIKNKSDRFLFKMAFVILPLVLYVYRFYTNLNTYVPYSFFVF